MRAQAIFVLAVLGVAATAHAQQAGDTSAIAAATAIPDTRLSNFLDVDVAGRGNRATTVLAQLRSVCAEVTDHPRAWSINRWNAHRCRVGKTAFGEGYVQYRARREAVD